MSAPPIMPLPAGLQMGDEFQVEKKLGQGGFGLTYLVRALKDIDDRVEKGSLYVVKEFAMSGYVVRAEDSERFVPLGNDDASREQNWSVFTRLRDGFRQEARTMAKFQHRNIVEVLLVREANETAYIIMEYVNGQPLSARVAERKSAQNFGLTWPKLQPIVHQMLDALEYIHDRNVIHRDIKPDNVMLRQNGDAVLIDFGGARTAERARGSMILTPGFAPAEQWAAFFKPEGGDAVTHDVGPATDIYSMAAAFYYAATGQPPYAMDDRGIPTAKHPALVGHALQAVLQMPEAAAHAIDCALNFEDSTRRPQSVREWRRVFPPIGFVEQPTPPSQPGPHYPADATHPSPGNADNTRQISLNEATLVREEIKKSNFSTTLGLILAGTAFVVALGVLGLLLLTDIFSPDDSRPYAVRFDVGEDWVRLDDAVRRSGRPLANQTATSPNPDLTLANLATEETAATITIAASDPFRIRYNDKGQVRVVSVSDPRQFPKLSSGQLAELEVRAVSGDAELVLANSDFAEKQAGR